MGGRKSFHEQLAEAERLVVETTGIVLRQIDGSLRALESRDQALAERVIASDDLVDEKYVEIEQRVLTLLATQAPVVVASVRVLLFTRKPEGSRGGEMPRLVADASRHLDPHD